MDKSIHTLRPSNKIIRTLDILDAKYNADGVIDFYWPLDNKKSEVVMNSITESLIPFIKQNEKKYSELLAIRLLFKWFVCEVLRTYEATVLSRRFNEDKISPTIPSHYKYFDAIYNSKQLACKFFVNHKNGPSNGRNINLTIKRVAKELIWNGLQIGLIKRYSNNKSEVLCVEPSKLTIKHANSINKLARYSSFTEWFSSIPESEILQREDTLGAIEDILQLVNEGFSAGDCTMAIEVSNYMRDWIYQANNFVTYYLNQKNDLLNMTQNEVWFGSGGSSIWHVILVEKLRRNGIKVVTHDHGSGNSHHEQTPVHWVEFMHTDHFVTYNQTIEKIKRKQLNVKLLIGQPKPLIQSIDNILGDETVGHKSRLVKKEGEIKKIMYVGTAFHGEGTRLRPIFHDMTYFDWQVKVFSYFKDKGIKVIYKPHPEGATHGPDDFAESFGFRTINKPLEEVKDEVDAYFIDFIFSSTTPLVLKSDKPVFFVNLGFPELLPEAKELIRKRCYYLDADYSVDSRLNIDWGKFDEFLGRKEHDFDMSFPDLYFKNV